MGLSLQEIESLVRTLKAEGVETFSYESLAISFASKVIPKPVDKSEPRSLPSEPTPGITTEKVSDSVVPQSLEEDMSFDKVLLWSSPNDDTTTPLTDDVPLNDTPILLPGEATPQVEGKP